MTYDEIKASLSKLVVEMTTKGIKTPSAKLSIPSDTNDVLWIEAHHESKCFSGQSYKTFRGDSQFNDAFEYLATLPSGEDAKQHEYIALVASAIDYGYENGISDEHILPLRGVKIAMTDNLLSKPKS